MALTDATTIDPALGAAYSERKLERLSDAALVRDVACAVKRPRRDPADSFVLHAPLELAARAALLPYVDPRRREDARLRIFSISSEYAAFGPPADQPAPVEFAKAADAATRLSSAIDDGDLDAVDAVAAWLGEQTTGSELRALLADAVVPRLSAAAHGSIFLYHLPRIAPRRELTAELLRPLARELARYPTWQLTWPSTRQSGSSRSIAAVELFDALARTPALGVPGSTFIFPLMSQAETSGIAADLLAGPTSGVALDEGARTIMRAAAWSMLLEPDDHAPYGWTHCLTLPQAVLGIASACTDPRAALAIAATYVVGFRAALAREPLVPAFRAPDPHIDLEGALAREPRSAAAAVWHAAPEAHTDIVGELATWASVHPDAHFVKYTLACIDAAAWDPTHAQLYLSAAAKLAGFWTGS